MNALAYGAAAFLACIALLGLFGGRPSGVASRRRLTVVLVAMVGALAFYSVASAGPPPITGTIVTPGIHGPAEANAPAQRVGVVASQP